MAHRDELLFQIIHQTSELWLKLAAAELEAAIERLDADQVWSAVRLVRSGGPRRLAFGNGLIALGTLTLSASGLFNSLLDEMEGFALTLALGVTILFAGFLVTSAPRARHLRVVVDEPSTVSAG